jgi:ABC-type phosphate transport system permease subunit
MAAAYTGFPVTLKLATVQVVAVTDISGPGISVTSIDVSTRDLLARKFLPGMYDPGEVTFSIVYDPDTATHQAITTAILAGTILAGILTLSDATPATITFSCFITNFSLKTPMDDAMTADITLKLTGAPVWA